MPSQLTEQQLTCLKKAGGNEFFERVVKTRNDPKTGKRRNLGTFKTRAAALKHEREVQFFKRS